VPDPGRFTELWVEEPSAREDLSTLVRGYLAGAGANLPVDAVVDLYLEAKELAVGWGRRWRL
jgi:midasin